jgi:cell division protein FtsB
MARNRRHQTAALRFAPALRALLLCTLIGGSGIGYVWQKNQIAHLSQQRKQRELRLRELEDSNDKLRKQLATLQSPPYIERRVKELNLGLVTASPLQKLRLWEPDLVAETPETPAGRAQYAATRAVPPPSP